MLVDIPVVFWLTNESPVFTFGAKHLNSIYTLISAVKTFMLTLSMLVINLKVIVKNQELCLSFQEF